MLPTPVRLLIILALAVPAVYAFTHDKTTVGLGLVAVALIQLYALVRYGSVISAGNAFRNGKRDVAWSRLGQTPLGGRLLRRDQKVYYHLLRASCQLGREEWDGAERDAERALGIEGVKRQNYAAAHGALARVHFARDDEQRARHHIARARELPHKSSLVPLLANLEDQLDAS